MRLGIVSDLHGNIRGLDLALERMGSVDEVWCAGDAFEQYCFSNEVVARLREIDARYILGNHEEVLLSPAGIRAQQSDTVDSELLEWVSHRPRRIRERLDGCNITMFHSTPWDPSGEYVYPHSNALTRFGALDSDVAIYGHTHTQLAREIDGTLVVNPGSAGFGQDPGNGRRLSFAILDTHTRKVEFDNFEPPSRD
ncbi:MAG: metallophosphoesterase family protein [Deltaproteobacteria bacterium]|nr:metallophosphoesterase family protein [Deltaproteobacteria bacterium]